VTSDGGPEDGGERNPRDVHDHRRDDRGGRQAADDEPVLPRTTSDEPVLPRTTSDEHPEAWGDRARDDDPDDLDRFLRERPPHHGD
jgi:hypothetical protein